MSKNSEAPAPPIVLRVEETKINFGGAFGPTEERRVVDVPLNEAGELPPNCITVDPSTPLRGWAPASNPKPAPPSP